MKQVIQTLSIDIDKMPEKERNYLYNLCRGMKPLFITVVSDSDAEVVYKEKGSSSRRFKEPTKEEIRDYMISKSYVDFSEKFYHHYNAIGWMVGKNKMKEWKSSVVGWVSRDQSLRKDSSTKKKTFTDD